MSLSNVLCRLETVLESRDISAPIPTIPRVTFIPFDDMTPVELVHWYNYWKPLLDENATGILAIRENLNTLNNNAHNAGSNADLIRNIQQAIENQENSLQRMQRRRETPLRMVTEWERIMATPEFTAELAREQAFNLEWERAEFMVPENLSTILGTHSNQVQELATALYCWEDDNGGFFHDPVYVLLKSGFDGFFWICDQDSKVQCVHERKLSPFVPEPSP